jgi:putative NIF3 family GTP cyclohydrolase 1 type 2
MAVILAGHTNTERGYLPFLRQRMLREGFAVPVVVAASDRDPLITV